MFARNVALRLKPNTLAEFTRTFDNEVIPMLRKQPGFQDEITLCPPGGVDVIAISLWDNEEHAEAYNTTGYPEVLKSLNKVLDGSPRVRVSNVISSTLYKTAVSVAA
jgi:heme-degrading monooxygenase HmoA